MGPRCGPSLGVLFRDCLALPVDFCVAPTDFKAPGECACVWTCQVSSWSGGISQPHRDLCLTFPGCGFSTSISVAR